MLLKGLLCPSQIVQKLSDLQSGNLVAATRFCKPVYTFILSTRSGAEVFCNDLSTILLRHHCSMPNIHQRSQALANIPLYLAEAKKSFFSMSQSNEFALSIPKRAATQSSSIKKEGCKTTLFNINWTVSEIDMPILICKDSIKSGCKLEHVGIENRRCIFSSWFAFDEVKSLSVWYAAAMDIICCLLLSVISSSLL